MARAGRKKKLKVKTLLVDRIDATPERIAMGYSEMVNPAEIDSHQPIGLTRRFRSSHLDRLYRNERLTWVQWYAGDWYRNTHHAARFGLSVVASYGERTSAGEPAYGLPRTESQLRARRAVMDARGQWPRDMIGFMDRLLIHDEMPKYGGRAAMRNLTRIRGALDMLAGYLRVGT